MNAKQTGKNNSNYRHGMSKTPLYRRWGRMKRSCNNPNGPTYKHYGGRGILVCPEWDKSFADFRDYVMSLPNAMKPGYTLDRIDNDGNYEPGNVQWADQHTQNANRRKISIQTKYVGISKDHNSFIAQIGVNHKKYYLGSFPTQEEAAEARDRFIIDNDLTEYPTQILTPALLKKKLQEEAEERLIEYVEYISELIDYINFLGEEMDETAAIAWTHGWKTSRYEEGIERRQKLDNISKAALLPEFTKVLVSGKEER